jgi:tripartite-type tricarboxylate transporter receptor subunit TctC
VPLSVKTVPEFLAWAKANPLGANFGSPAAGSTPHFIGALLGKNAGVDLKHAAYRGTQPAMLDLLGGNVSAVSGPIGDLTQHLPTGKVRILGVSGAKRNRFAPDVPTYEEQGIKNATHSEWFAFFLPAKASPELVARLNASMKNALAQKDVIDGLNGFGLEAMSSTPAELTELIKRDTAKWAPIVKQVGFTAEA